MIKPEDFLRIELDNVENCIKEVLRNQYGAQFSNKFFIECNRRLDAIRDLTKAKPLSDAEVTELAKHVLHISQLLSRIERAHQGEFSWSFAREIRSLAEQVCNDPAASPHIEALFFFSSDGGLDKYRIASEQTQLLPAAMPLFNVVFPRTIKHHVLLHPILGHEIFHAAMTIAKSTAAANRAGNALISGSVINFADLNVFPAWLVNSYGTDPANLKWLVGDAVKKMMISWVTEFLCDIFGLLLMGPCFIGAQLTILSSFNPKADDIGESHPPPLCRFWVLLCAVEHLGWMSADEAFTKSGRVGTAYEAYWDDIRRMDFSAPWVQLIPKSSVQAAVDSMLADAALWGTSFFSPPDEILIRELFDQAVERIPPVGVQKFLGNKPLQGIDFRVILYVGWLALKDGTSKLTFNDANGLCEHAILQQQAIKLQLGLMTVTES